MERVLERFRRRLCLRVFRAEHALLLKKNASTMNLAHVSMGADCRADYCRRRQNYATRRVNCLLAVAENAWK